MVIAVLRYSICISVCVFLTIPMQAMKDKEDNSSNILIKTGIAAGYCIGAAGYYTLKGVVKGLELGYIVAKEIQKENAEKEKIREKEQRKKTQKKRAKEVNLLRQIEGMSTDEIYNFSFLRSLNLTEQNFVLKQHSLTLIDNLKNMSFEAIRDWVASAKGDPTIRKEVQSTAQALYLLYPEPEQQKDLDEHSKLFLEAFWPVSGTLFRAAIKEMCTDAVKSMCTIV